MNDGPSAAKLPNTLLWMADGNISQPPPLPCDITFGFFTRMSGRWGANGVIYDTGEGYPIPPSSGWLFTRDLSRIAWVSLASPE